MDKQQMLELAAFNKLALTPAEEGEMMDYLDYALGALAKMAELDTAGMEPMVFSVDFTNVFRQDTAVKTVSREEVLANAPQQSAGCFQVPKVLD